MNRRLSNQLMYSLIYFFIALAAQADEIHDLLERGERQVSSGKYKKAVKTFRQAYAMSHPSERTQASLAEALFRLAEDCLERGDHRQAGEALKEYLELTNEAEARFKALMLLGKSLYLDEGPSKKKRLEAAEQIYLEALKVSGGKDWGASFGLAQVLRDQGRPQEGLMFLRRFSMDELESELRRETRLLICDLKRTLGAPAEAPLPYTAQVGGDRGFQGVKKLWGPFLGSRMEARVLRLKGTVLLDGIIDVDGCVASLETVQYPHWMLKEDAERAVRRWVYSPATLNGEAVASRLRIILNFL